MRGKGIAEEVCIDWKIGEYWIAVIYIYKFMKCPLFIIYAVVHVSQFCALQCLIVAKSMLSSMPCSQDPISVMEA